MAGRYTLTPARRAALKRAAAKSAAKRKKSSAGRKQYRAANRASRKQINSDYRKGKYGGVAKKLLTSGPQRKARADYARARNNNAVKYKGAKRKTDKQLRRRQRAASTALVGLAVASNVATQYALTPKNQRPKLRRKKRR